MNKPPNATHIEDDGTYWRNQDGDWYWWREGWGWCSYAGLKNQGFLNKMRAV